MVISPPVAYFGERLVERALKVYATYGSRFDPMAQVRTLLPPRLEVVGFVGRPDDISISLWRPFGSRRVENILVKDSPAQIRGRHVEYAVVNPAILDENRMSLPAWLHQTGAELMATIFVQARASEGPQPWYVVRFRPQY